jgi:hypothetical protein
MGSSSCHRPGRLGSTAPSPVECTLLHADSPPDNQADGCGVTQLRFLTGLALYQLIPVISTGLASIDIKYQ